MNFRRGRHREDPEINFIPLIDLLLVILIFLVVSTTYARFSALKIQLPTAEPHKTEAQPAQIDIAVDAHNRFLLNNRLITFQTPIDLAEQLKAAAGATPDPTVVIQADAQSTHQNVIDIMEAARLAGYEKLTFTTQTATPADRS